MSELVLEKNNDLLNSWELVKISEVSELIRGVSYKKSDSTKVPKSDLMGILRATNIQSNLTFENMVYVPKKYINEKQMIKKNDVIISMSSGSKHLVGKSAQSSNNTNVSFGTFCACVRPLKKINGKYFGYFFKSDFYNKSIQSKSMGVNINNLRREHVENLEIPIPPINEQKRIVKKIEEIFLVLDNVELRLEEIKYKLTIFRDSVIDHAFNRKFTNFMKSDPDCFWKDMELEQVLETRGMFDGPFGSNLKTKDYTSTGIRVIRLENIKQLHFDDSKQSYIDSKKYQTLKKHTVLEGDIIFASFVDSKIRCCMIPKFDGLAINKADCFCIRADKEQILPEFLMFQLCSKQFYSNIKQKIHGVTRKRVNTRQLKKSNIKLCSIDEQKEIIRIININLNLIEYTLSEINTQHSNIKNLKKIILIQAFEGKLVHQDPNDEPAEILLQKIKQEQQLIQKQRVAKRSKNAK